MVMDLANEWSRTREQFGDGSPEEGAAWAKLRRAWGEAVSSRPLPEVSRTLASQLDRFASRAASLAVCVVTVGPQIVDAADVVRKSGCTWRKELSLNGAALVASPSGETVQVRVVDRGMTVASAEV